MLYTTCRQAEAQAPAISPFSPPCQCSPQHDDKSSEAKCRSRVALFWESTVLPAVGSGKRVLIVAHENSLRALMMHMDPSIPADDVLKFEIPRFFTCFYPPLSFCLLFFSRHGWPHFHAIILSSDTTNEGKTNSIFQLFAGPRQSFTS
jgi:broad specificity phosphatase PhoE